MPKTQTTKNEDHAVTMNHDRKYYYGTGKRKTSVARVRLYEKGKGEVSINGQSINKFSPLAAIQHNILYPLELTGNMGKFDISIKVDGGGITGQAEAMRHGISRALTVFDETLRGTLKKAGLITRDSRIKERKKYGLKRARRAPQFSKR